MNKREFLKTLGLLGLAGIFGVVDIFARDNKSKLRNRSIFSYPLEGKFVLPSLPFAYQALEPHIDTLTMQIHHTKHHQAYIDKLNQAIEGKPEAALSLEEILSQVTDNQAAIRNNAGGHYNHSLFWTLLSPQGGGVPSGKLAKAIDKTFGSFDKMKAAFEQAAMSRFGSGWVWLALDRDGKLFISTTPNQDNPLMQKIEKQLGTPIISLDLWEHAYYLAYQNKRADYVRAFWNIIDWKEAEKRFKMAK